VINVRCLYWRLLGFKVLTYSHEPFNFYFCPFMFVQNETHWFGFTFFLVFSYFSYDMIAKHVLLSHVIHSGKG